MLSIVVLVLLQFGCADRSVTPKPTKSFLYAARWGTEHGSIDVVDCETDSLIKTITDSSFRELLSIYASPDGEYLMVPGYGETLIWSTRTDQIVVLLPHSFRSGIFVPERDVFVGLARRMTAVYTIPEGNLVAEHDVELTGGVLVPGRPWIIGRDLDDLSILQVFDLDAGQVLDSIVIDPGSGAVDFSTVAVSPDGQLLYAGVKTTEPRSAAICYDLAGDSLRFLIWTGVPYTTAVSPDGNELWVSQLRTPTSPIHSILVCDARTGAFKARIDTEVYDWPALHIAFCKEQERAYLSSLYVVPILIIDAASHTIVREITPTPGAVYQSIAVQTKSY